MDIQNDTKCCSYFIEWKSKNPLKWKGKSTYKDQKNWTKKYRIEDGATRFGGQSKIRQKKRATNIVNSSYTKTR